MEIAKLEWDSNFFQQDVYKVIIPGYTKTDELNLLLDELITKRADIAYIVLDKNDDLMHDALLSEGAILYDEKITYWKSLNIGQVTNFNYPEIELYNGILTDELLELAILAGSFSRFRKDPHFAPNFRKLFSLWMINSLNNKLADRIFIYREAGCIKGMVTCSTKGQDGTIGLIATSPEIQRRGIGKQLIAATESVYQFQGVQNSFVVTQQENAQACRFYEREGFTAYKKEYVYHWWFKN